MKFSLVVVENKSAFWVTKFQTGEKRTRYFVTRASCKFLIKNFEDATPFIFSDGLFDHKGGLSLAVAEKWKIIEFENTRGKEIEGEN